MNEMLNHSLNLVESPSWELLKITFLKPSGDVLSEVEDNDNAEDSPEVDVEHRMDKNDVERDPLGGKNEMLSNPTRYATTGI